MKTEWRDQAVSLSLRHLAAAVIVSLLLCISELPSIKEGEYLSCLSSSFAIGMIIGTCIWLAYALHFAVKGSLIRTNPGHFAVSFPGMAVGMIAARVFRGWVKGAPPEYGGIVQGWLIGAFVLLAFIFYYSYRRTRDENLQLSIRSAEADYRALKGQTQPHFLFNALNSLSELIHSDPRAAAEMAQKLADLYRQILLNSKRKTASLDSEISIVRRYLELEQLRFGERLSFTIEAPVAAETIHVPTLVLQTLVENAVKHGIGKSMAGGRIHLLVKENSRGHYELTLSNTGARFEGRSAGGTGLRNTEDRLRLLYGEESRFDIRSDAALGTVASFRFSGVELA